MIDNPLVSVNILSYNRKEELRFILTKVHEQDYNNIEVIVVDNASQDGSQEMVKKEFSTVKIIELKQNIGIAGWNKGFEIANGEYILVLDDDAYPEENAIKLIVDEFRINSNIGAIAIKVLNKYENNLIKPFPGGWVPIGLKDNLNWSLVLGCAFAIKKELFIDGLFVSKYFINFHELPIVLQIFRKGYLIKYSEKINAYHINQIFGKYNKEKECLHVRNMINFIYYHFSKPLNLIMLLRVLFFYSTRAIKKGWFVCYLKALKDLRNTLITFTNERLSKKKTKDIIATGIIEYKFLKKLKN